MLLHSPEIKRTGYQENQHNQHRDNHHPTRHSRAEECPAETFDNAGHRVEAIQEPDRFRHERGRIHDRRGKEPELDDERDCVLEVTELYVQCREPEPYGQGCCESEKDENRQENDIDGRDKAIVCHHDNENGDRYTKICEGRENAGYWHDKAGEVDFGHDARVRHHARCRPGQPLRKERPREKSGKDEEGVRDSVRRDPGKPAEEEREDDHHEEWLDDRPENTECRLLVPEPDVPQREGTDELAVFPELVQVHRHPSLRRADDKMMGLLF